MTEDGAGPGQPSVRLTRTLTADDVGARVVVRRRLPEGGLGDVLGRLTRWDGDTLVVRRSDGSDVEVRDADMVAGKPVPPPPPRGPWHRRIDDLALEEVAAQGWRAVERAQLGGWLLRASGGFTLRGNSVLPLGDPGLPLPQALAHVTDWYARRGLPPVVQVPLPARSDLHGGLERHGWHGHDETVVMTADPRELVAPPVAHRLPPVRSGSEPDGGWLAAYHYRGGDLPATARRLLLNAEEQSFLSVRDERGVVATARTAVTGRWTGLFAMEVAPRARRRGLGRHVLHAVGERAAALGCRGVYLQVGAGNAVARAFYDRAGFTGHHRYVYLSA